MIAKANVCNMMDAMRLILQSLKDGTGIPVACTELIMVDQILAVTNEFIALTSTKVRFFFYLFHP
jgi:hypothetical protein